MFKKPFSILAAFATGLVISVSIMACADDLQEIVNCNCNDTIKELLTRIETLEKRVETIKEPNYDSLVKLVVEHLNTTTPAPTPTPTECPNEERLAAIEQVVDQLKNASAMENIGKYKWSSNDILDESESFTCEYDELGRLIKFRVKVSEEQIDTGVFHCTYNDNVCTMTCDGVNDVWTFTLADENSRNFDAVKQAILGIFIQ